jgi:hypothetical protein
MRDAAARRLRTVRRRFRKVIALSRSLGVIPTGVYIWHKIRMAAVPSSRPYRLLSKHSRYPLVCRPNTSDNPVFGQIFIEREYACLDDLPGANLIIDCGANVGYSSAYFLSRFPECRVIDVEPDPSNFSILEKNLAPYGERVRAIRTGIWSHVSERRPS